MLATRIANAGVSSSTVNVIGDGNCAFRAILVACRLKNLLAFTMPEEQHHLLREMVVDFAIFKGRYEFNIFTTEQGNKRDWERAMRQPGVWADALAIRACSEMLEIPIQVIMGNRVAMEFGQEFYHRNGVTRIDNTIRLFLQDGHYSVVV